MIIVYIQNESGSYFEELTKTNTQLLELALWVDLISPTKKEEKLVEKFLSLDVPTKKEMEGIELSSRLYTEDEALFMTATMVAQSDSPEPKAEAVTFILTEKQMITVRYIEPVSFKLFIARLSRSGKKDFNAEKLLVRLLESTTDRLADILETVSHRVDEVSQIIFHQDENGHASGINYRKVLQKIGSNGYLNTKVRESLVSFLRLGSFLEQAAGSRLDLDLQTRLRINSRDISALSDYATFISNKVSFLLDATLGMVNIEQNNIIKIFSVAAVIFLPPTLIASIYGMNFQFMPELNWKIGYPISIGMMLLSAWLPYQYFKKRGWL